MISEDNGGKADGVSECRTLMCRKHKSYKFRWKDVSSSSRISFLWQVLLHKWKGQRSSKVCSISVPWIIRRCSCISYRNCRVFLLCWGGAKERIEGMTWNEHGKRLKKSWSNLAYLKIIQSKCLQEEWFTSKISEIAYSLCQVKFWVSSSTEISHFPGKPVFIFDHPYIQSKLLAEEFKVLLVTVKIKLNERIKFIVF